MAAKQVHRHCQPTGPRAARPDDKLSEAIQSGSAARNCFVASLLAMSAMICAGGAAAATGINLPIPCEAVDRVGTATMTADGIITLRVHALWPQRYTEYRLVYAPGDAQYENVNTISAASRRASPSRCRRCAG